MLSFSKSFFEGETIDGHYVRPMVKREWASMLEVLAEIDRVCKKHGITYFADFGTMLGAVRHKGFIPWDDDLDIAMKREDYNRFINIAPEEFNNFEETDEYPDRDDIHFFCHTLYTAKREEKNHTIVSNSRAIIFDDDFLSRNHGCPFVMGVDIFPLDYIPSNNAETETLNKILSAMVYLIEIGDNWDANGNAASQEVANEIMTLGKMVGFTDFNDKTASLRVQLARLFDQLSKMFSREESDYLDHFYWYATAAQKKPIPKEWYDDVIYVPFENISIPIPAEYDKILTLIYGDYMKPVVYADHGLEQAKLLDEMDFFKGRDTLDTLEELVKDYV